MHFWTFLGFVLIFVMASLVCISPSSPLPFTPHGWSSVVGCSLYQLWIMCYALCFDSSVFHLSALYPPGYIATMAQAVDLSRCILCSSDTVGCTYKINAKNQTVRCICKCSAGKTASALPPSWRPLCDSLYSICCSFWHTACGTTCEWAAL
jgi:hypothetical protein